MVRTKQGGSILSFIIVGVALAVLLIGGVWAVRHYDLGALQGESTPTDVADKPETDNKPSAGTDSSPATAPDDAANDTAAQPETRRETSPAPREDATSDDATANETILPSGGASEQVATLPETGATDVLSGLSTAALVGAVIAYAVSRRQVAGL